MILLTLLILLEAWELNKHIFPSSNSLPVLGDGEKWKCTIEYNRNTNVYSFQLKGSAGNGID
jgi:hypothetical protein